MREQYGPIMQEQSPSRFGNYELVRRIDVGGMGEVYLARQRSAFGRVVAIKIIRSDLVHDVTARARFLREAEVSAHLKHEHILPLFEFGEDQGRLFLVTPYIEGGTLARRLQSGPLSLSEVRQFFIPLLQAAAYIHRRGVIHRDLKPTNILLDEEDGQVYVRLIDFGIASIQGSTASPPLTTAGNEVGTIAYMAPERLSGVVAPSNDIFSLGVILYQMLTGRFPVGQNPPNLPKPFEYVVHRCIAVNPEDRFATAEELLKNFERACQLLLTSSQVPSTTPPASLDAPSSSQVSRSLNTPSKALLADVEGGEAARQELVALQNSGSIPAIAQPQPQRAFGHEDYNAPTAWFDPVKHQGQQPVTGRPTPSRTPSTGSTGTAGKQRNFLPLLSAITIIVFLAVIVMGYYAYEAITATSVTVNFSPQTHVISQLYTLNANPGAQSVNIDTKTIPARVFTAKEQNSSTGQTTGQVNCVLGVFSCQQGVSQDDVNRLVSQMQPVLEQKIKQALLKQLASVTGTQVSSINFQDPPPTVTADPSIGSAGTSVTVTLSEQGSVGYILNTDAQSVARQLLIQQAQQFGQNYTLLKPTIQTGLPIIEGVDGSGIITIDIAAGCLVEYQFPASQLQAMQHNLVGKTLKEANTYLALQPGVDPKTVGYQFTRGKSDTLPGDAQQITITPINPVNLPPVHLPNVPTPTITPSVSLTPGESPSPMPTPTQTGDGGNN